MKKIVYMNLEGGLSIVNVSNEAELDTASFDVPSECVAFIVEETIFPKSLIFRDAWELVDGEIKENNLKAIDIAKNKIRAWRETQFEKNDIAIQNALLDGVDLAEVIARRNYLRNLTSACDGKNPSELKEILEELA